MDLSVSQYQAMIGVGGLHTGLRRAIPGVGAAPLALDFPSPVEPSPEAVQEVGSTDAAIQSLANDINTAVSRQSAPNDALTLLQANDLDFTIRWESWKGLFDARDTATILTNADTLERFKSEYRILRQRFVSLGGVPTSNLPTIPPGASASDRLKAITDALGTVGTIGVAGVGLYFLFPLLAGVLGAKLGK